MGCLTPYQSTVCYARGQVGCGASLLWSGFIRRGVERLCYACLTAARATVVAPRKRHECALADGASGVARCELPVVPSPSRVWFVIP